MVSSSSSILLCIGHLLFFLGFSTDPGCDHVEMIMDSSMMSMWSSSRIPIGICAGAYMNSSHQKSEMYLCDSNNDVQYLEYEDSFDCSGDATTDITLSTMVTFINALFNGSVEYQVNEFCNTGYECGVVHIREYMVNDCDDDVTAEGVPFEDEIYVAGSCMAVSYGNVTMSMIHNCIDHDRHKQDIHYMNENCNATEAYQFSEEHNNNNDSGMNNCESDSDDGTLSKIVILECGAIIDATTTTTTATPNTDTPAPTTPDTTAAVVDATTAPPTIDNSAVSSFNLFNSLNLFYAFYYLALFLSTIII
jgi:hypothetical protein